MLKWILLALLPGLFSAQVAAQQFFYADSNIYFLIDDSNGKPLRDAAVYYDGRRMQEVNSGDRYPRTYYRLAGARDDDRLHRIRVVHKHYQVFDDTLYGYAQIRLMPLGQQDYYYDHVKVPCKPFSGWLFSRIPDRFPPDSLINIITLAGGEVRDSFLLCGSWKGVRQVPPKDALVYCLPPTPAGDSLKSWLYRYFHAGPYVEVPSNHYQPRTGFKYHFVIHFRAGCQDTVQKLLQARKDSGQISRFGSSSEYDASRLLIELPPREVEKMVDIIDSLLSSGFFFDPVMELMQFICLD